jgi:hypothetical protein
MSNMVTIQLSAIVDKNGQLTAKVPDNVPPGPINIIIQSPESSSTEKLSSARDAARAKLAAAGLLSTAHRLPPNTRIPSDAEVEAAGKLPADARPSEDLINEDRNEA